MAAIRNWCARLGVMISVLTLSLFVPAAAWAATGPGEVVIEAARRRRGAGGFLTLLCCLAVVGIVVLLVVLLMRRRRGR